MFQRQYRLSRTCYSQRSQCKPLPFGALASNDETGQQSIVDEGGILYLSEIQ
ncbi:FimD/PapC C-terminal domain-containing protein [Escherichia coli]